MEYAALAALITALGTALKVFWPARSESRVENVETVVDSDVLQKFLEVTTRIGQLEAELRSTQAELARAVKEIAELRKLEEYLQARLHEKDKEIDELRDARALLLAELRLARDRIAHLEDMCKRAGLNGPPEQDENSD